MLALEILGVDKKIEWVEHTDLNKNNSTILNIPAGKRIQTLIQVGFADELEKEIIHINSILNRSSSFSDYVRQN